MEMRVLGCYGGELPGYRLCSFLIDKKLLLDAGAVTSVLKLSEQRRISHILITHTHLDHIKDLPFLAANLVREPLAQPINIISTSAVIEGLKYHLFNNSLWPDFTVLPTAESPVLRFTSVEPQVDVFLQNFSLRAIPVNHTVPAVGYIIRRGRAAILYTGDTGASDRIWEEANDLPNLKAVVVESSFPNHMQAVAESSRHLTPMILKKELNKLRRKDIPVLLAHMKPQYLDLLKKDVHHLNSPRVSFLRQGACYRF